MEVNIAIFFGMLVIFAILTVVLSLTVFGFSDTDKPKNVEQKDLPNYPDAYWQENSRGYSNVEIYPPCYDISSPAKKAYSLMLSRNLVPRYKKMFEIMSYVCCQQKELQKKDCSRLGQRINNMVSLGADPNNKFATLSAAAYTALQNTDNSKFIICAFSLLEEQMEQIEKDTDVDKVDKETMRGFLHIFYNTHFDTINKISCKD